MASTTVSASDITIFTAGKIITMEEALPEASAVAVSKGKIVSVGTLQTLRDYIDNHGATVDRRFEGKVLMPGFIEPHVHPSLPAVLTQFAFLAPDDWELPTGKFPGATTHEAYIEKLTELVAAYNASDPDPKVPFIA
jgi:cytosine/adenosine deaminase-related metal-dependent hydrolase